MIDILDFAIAIINGYTSTQMRQQHDSHHSSRYVPFVSVVIPVRNGQEHLGGLFEALVDLSYPTELYEVLLVDNLSSDSTPLLLDEFCRKQESGSIRWLSEPSMPSSFAARNAGILSSSGEIIAFTDVDALPAADWLSELVKPFEDQSVGVVAGAVVPACATTWVESYAIKNEVLSHKRTLSDQFLPFGATVNLAVRRNVFERVGLFRKQLEPGGDWDMCWRILKSKDWQLEAAENAVVSHCHRKTLSGIRRQVRSFGVSCRYAETLYGPRKPVVADLGGRLPTRLTEWLFSELPAAAADMFAGRDPRANLFGLPMDVVLGLEYLCGYFGSSLAPSACQIEYLPTTNSSLSRTTGAD